MDIVLSSGSALGCDPDLALRFLYQGAKVVNRNRGSERDTVPASRKVHILAVVHGWFPNLAAGSERMLQHMLDALPRDEFEVEILSQGVGDPQGSPGEYWYEGTRVKVGYIPDFTPDLIVTHHGPASRVTSGLVEVFPKVPIVAVFHNERLDIEDILSLNAELNVFNTKWVKASIGHNGMVIHPPLEYERHHVDKTGDEVTLVNLQKNKGIDTLHRLCSLMPDVKFLGVTGSHGKQEPMPFQNLEVLPITQDMKEVWSRTKVLLAPSEYESFGMVAAEACVSGIPVIAHPTPGLVECLGFAGIFVDREDTATYERTLRLLLTDDQAYAERSAMAFERGRQIVSQTQRELTRFVNAVRKVVRK